MSGARELRQRIQSVAGTEQITGAMKTVAVSKYNRALTALKGFEEYADACEKLLRWLPQNTGGSEHSAPTLYVLVSANRGLCGEYNTELLHFYEELTKDDSTCATLFCGNRCIVWAQEQQNRDAENCFSLSDVPSYEEAAALTKRLRESVANGTYSRVVFLTQRYKNVLIQNPEATPFLPFAKPTEAPVEDRYLWMPSRAAIEPQLLLLAENAFVYRLLLEAASGAHGATLTAMRAASDNAADIHRELSTELNRLRQSSVTTAVIELASGHAEEDSDREEENT